jgi:hypothetical protein
MLGDFRWRPRPSTAEADVAFKAVEALPPLGALAALVDTTFHGVGLNTIFRPMDPNLPPTPLDNPVTGQAAAENDNLLQLSLTKETLAFDKQLGNVPNRGFAQADMFLNGLPYVQRIDDNTDPTLYPLPGIHFEPGVWLNVPETTVPPEGVTLARMASIPHGTTINAQGTSTTIPGAPTIPPVNITPTFINGGAPFRFKNQNAKDPNTFRLPQDLSSFIADGTITQEILDDPNLLLRRRAEAQNILSTDEITIDTNPADPLFGGGTDNIAFLRGDPNGANPNADAVHVTATFWIETVSEEILLPALQPGQVATVRGAESFSIPPVQFEISSATEVADGTTVEVTYTQIQYTQNVTLNFAPLSWPHVTVATLVPQGNVQVQL